MSRRERERNAAIKLSLAGANMETQDVSGLPTK
jgi:hypothetical protein